MVNSIGSITPVSAGHPGDDDLSESEKAASLFAAALEAATRANGSTLPAKNQSPYRDTGTHPSNRGRRNKQEQ